MKKLALLTLIALLAISCNKPVAESTDDVVDLYPAQKRDGNGQYASTQYGFSLNYPTGDWYAQEDPGAGTEGVAPRAQTTIFGNVDVRSLNKSNMPPHALYFLVSAYDKNNSTAMKSYRTVKTKVQARTTEKEQIEAIDAKVELLVTKVKSAKQDETWDSVLPLADAFFENDKYAFHIHNPSEFPESGQQQLVEIIRSSLRTLKLH